MAGFTKLFGSILDSTIWRRAPDHVRLVWITMLAMADQYGIAEGSVPGLADRARVTLDEAIEALDMLSAPDEWSRSKEYDGRRIEAVDGGWRLLNYLKYREKTGVQREPLSDSPGAIRVRRHRAKRDAATAEAAAITDDGDRTAEGVTGRYAGVTPSASSSVSAFDLNETRTTKELVRREVAEPAAVSAGSVTLPDPVAVFVDKHDVGGPTGFVAGFLRSRKTSLGIMAIFELHLSGEMGYLHVTPETLVLAVQEYAANTPDEVGFNAAHFAGFLRRINGRLAQKREQDRIEAETEAKRQRAAEARAAQPALRGHDDGRPGRAPVPEDRDAAEAAEGRALAARRAEFAHEHPTEYARLRREAEAGVPLQTEPFRTAMIEGRMDTLIRHWELAHEHDHEGGPQAPQETAGAQAGEERQTQDSTGGGQAGAPPAAQGPADRQAHLPAGERPVSGEPPRGSGGDEDRPHRALAGGQGDVGPGAPDGHPAPDRPALRGAAGLAGDRGGPVPIGDPPGDVGGYRGNTPVPAHAYSERYLTGEWLWHDSRRRRPGWR